MTDQESLPQRIRTFLLEPDIFFRQLAEKPVQYRWPLAIALITGIVLCRRNMAYDELDVLICLFPDSAGAGPESGVISSIYGMIIVFTSAFAIFHPFIILIISRSGILFPGRFCFKGWQPLSRDHRCRLGNDPARDLQCSADPPVPGVPAGDEPHDITGIFHDDE